MGGNMKVHQYDQFPGGLLTRSNCWDQQQSQLETHTTPSSFTTTDITSISFDLKTFIKTPNKTPASNLSNHKITDQSTQVETTTTWQAAGGTRWNPTQEQIAILEKLYKGGMRTPNGQEIEKITAHLGKYGKIEGKNVFYWFQNHKARQRQKLNRLKYNLATSSPPTSSSTTTLSTLHSKMEDELEVEESQQMKRKRSWAFMECEERREKGHKTLLQLFPLHPEGR